MNLHSTICKMDLSELTCFEDAIRKLIKQQRKKLVGPMIQAHATVGVIQKTKARKGQKRRAFRLNAKIVEIKRGVLILEVLEPESFRGQKMEADLEFLYEPFGSPGETEVIS